jgi:3-oxoacyl-[acyl-carrier-protein] synthase II
VFVSGVASVGPNGRLRGREHVVYADEVGDAPPRQIALDALSSLVPVRSRRFDRVTSASALAVADALEGLAAPLAEVGLCLGVAWCGISRTVRFLQRLKQRGSRGVNPGEFPHLVPSAAAGNVSIYHGLGGPVVPVASGAASGVAALGLDRDLMYLGLSRHNVVCASAEH